MGNGAYHYKFQRPSDLAAAVARFRKDFPEAEVRIVRDVAETRDPRFATIANRYRAAVSDLTAAANSNKSAAATQQALQGHGATAAPVAARAGLYEERLVPAASFKPPPFFPAEVKDFYRSAAYQESLTTHLHPLMRGQGPQDDGRVTLHGTNTELPDAGHVMATNVRGDTHSSFAPRNSELGRGRQLPTHSVGSLKAFPQADRNVGAFYTAGKLYGLREDPYVFKDSGEVDPTSGVRTLTDVPKNQQFAFAFDPRFIDPVAFAEEVGFADAHAASDLREAAYQVATVCENPLENPGAETKLPLSPALTKRGNIQRQNIQERGTNQANNCVTDLMWKLFDTPVPNPTGGAPTRTVLMPEDLLRMGMEIDSTGGTLSFAPGRDLRPQDLFLYVRWAEQQHLASLSQG